ncbi:hypothetical protein AAAA73_00475 [Bdellovibrio sp. GT3]
MIVRYLLVFLTAVMLGGCLESTSSSSAIVIPPGGLILLDMRTVNVVGEDHYSLYLAEYVPAENKTRNLLDMTTDEKPDQFRKILPKNLALTSSAVAKVVMEYRSTPWYAIVFPDVVNKVDVDSTLVFSLLSSYPNRALTSYTHAEVLKITEAVKKFREERMAMFAIAKDFNPDLLYRFVRNGLSTDVQFLTMLESHNVLFDFDGNGDIAAEPFPFNIDNRPPIVDDQATTKQIDQNVNEMATLQMRAAARDPDGDEVFYAWAFENQPIASEDGLVKWIPNFEHGRLNPYQMSVIFSDGGKVTRINWNVFVNNVNRRPEYTHSCALAALENIQWVCKISYRDPDNEKVSVSLEPIDGSGPITINGAVAPAQVDNVNEVELRWTPTNSDALKRSATVALSFTDESLGLTVGTLNLAVSENNSAPYLVDGVAGAKVVNNDPYEYDYCANEVPDGLPIYRYYFDIVDPDNLITPTPSPGDVVSITTAGTLNSNMTKVSETAIAGGIRYTYDWKPTHAAKTGTFIVSAKDNHGGLAAAVTLTFTSQDRNTKPCLGGGDVNTTLLHTSAGANSNYSSSDRDGGALWVEAFGFAANNSYDMLKLVMDCGSTQPMLLKQNITQTEPTYRKNSGTLCIRGRWESDWWGGAGYVIFERSSVRTGRPTAATTIKKGTVLTSTVAGYVQKFKTHYDVVVQPQDFLLYVPVVPETTDVPAGKVTVFESANPGGLSVTNTAVIDLKGMVTFSRATATAAVTIPAGTIVKTAEFTGTPFVNSVKFEVPGAVIMPIGTTTITVPVWRLYTVLPTNSPLSISYVAPSADQAGFPFTAKAAPNLTNYDANSLNVEPNFNTPIAKRFTVRALDGEKPTVNAINAFVDPLPAAAVTLTVRNPASFDMDGLVNFSRTNTTAAFTLPAGTKLMTTNRTLYETMDAVTMNAGTATVNGIWVRRTNNIGSPAQRTVTYSYSHSNVVSKLITDPIVQASEGVPLTNGAIEVSDNFSEIPSPFYAVTNYWYPYDRRDTYSFNLSVSGTAPTGTWDLCRDPGNAGTACSNRCVPVSGSNFLSVHPSSGRKYFNTNKCYLRYTPVTADLSGTFSFKLTVYEIMNKGNPDTWTSQTNWTTNITLVVNEINHPSILTDASFNNQAAGVGASTSNPINLGSFDEGIAGYYNIYTKDTNKGLELKTTNFELEPQVYDLKTSTWVPRPAGLGVSVDKVEDLTAAAGSKTTARISWMPTDQESKQFSGSAGFVVKMKIYDAKSSPDLTQTIYGYYKVRVTNKNQIPSIGQMAPDNQVRVFADTYVKKEFYLYDNDAYTPQGGSFSTQLSICRDSNGNPLQHATLDPGSADPYICHATTTTFASEVANYDPAYVNNRNVSPCFVSNALNTDLAIPKFTPVGSPELNAGILRQKYQMEWCPQRGHIGVYSAELNVSDNGDVDRDSVALAKALSSSPLQLTIVAPVFLLSPRVDINNVPVHYMPQAAASMNSYPFRYEVLVNNSQKNPLEYSLLNAPRACGESNGVCIDPLTGVISWIPNHTMDVTPINGAGSLVRVQVKDTVTGDLDSAHFYLKVQNALSPFEESPVINSVIPSGDSVLLSEKTTLSFSVSATDPNTNDTVFYRWYVNDVLKYDESSTFAFKPSDTDGSVDIDGTGPKTAGEYTVRVDVTDGNYVVSRSWTVKVKNTYLLGESIFDLANARLEGLPATTPQNVVWSGEVPYGIAQGTGYQDHLIIYGSYLSGAFIKHFLWDLLSVNGVVSKPNGTITIPPWNFTEALPWLSGTSTRRVAINPLGTGYDMLMTVQPARNGPFGLTTEALHILNGDLTTLTLSGNNKCSGDCPTQLYTSPHYSDSRITASMDSAYVFYASDSQTVLHYDYLTPDAPKTVYNFGTAKITGMTLNRAIDRLYVTTQQTTPSVAHRIFVFNVTPARSGGIPSLVANLSVFDGVAGHEDCKPSDIVYDSVTNRVYALLSGTGGVVTFPDSASTTPTTGTMQFIGVNELNASVFDVPGGGRRLAIRASDRLLIGTMEGANQVFTIDLNDNRVYVSAVQVPIASIASYESGQILLISRSKGKVLRAK